MGRKVFALLLVLVTVFIMGGCGASMSISGLPDPEKIVPKREVLVENLEGKGYKIEALTSVEGSDLVVDRVLAQKGN